MANTSGRGSASAVPDEIRGWNWGAFLLNAIWGIGNNTLIALLALVPVVNLVMPFVLGAKGNEWAWRNRQWDSVAAFKATQRTWTKVGVVVLVVSVLIGAAAVAGVYGLLSTMKRADVYQSTSTLLRADPDARRILGAPITTGLPMGNMQINGPSGSAAQSFSASGPSGEGTVYVEATRALGRWTIDRAELEDDATQRRYDLTD